MAQENINYGSFPDDPLANTIRDAFVITQNNFTQLFAGAAANANVAQIAAGAGISVSPANGVGNVTVTNTFNSLRVRSNTLSVSSIGGTMDGSTVVIPNSTATLLLEISSNTNANSSLYNLTVANSLTINGNSIISANANITLTNGNIVLTHGQVNGNINAVGGNGAIQFSNPNGTITGTSVFYYDTALSKLIVPAVNSAQINSADSNIANGIFTNLSANSTTVSTLTASGNISGANASFSGNISAIRVTGNLSGNLIANSLANTVIYYAANGVSTGSSNLSYNGTNLTFTGGTLISANIAGNLTGTASSALNVVNGTQANITELGNLNFLNVFGSTVVGSLAANTTVTGASATFTNANVSNALTVTNIESSRGNFSLDVVARTVNANVSLNTPSLSANTGSFANYATAPRVLFTPQTSAPTSPAGGTVYYNSVTGKLQVYNGVLSVWQDLN
jgi:hypothetical protein